MEKVKPDGSRNVLTHLQQLREWQQQQQTNLRSIQQQKWEQLHKEQEKIQKLLQPYVSKDNTSAKANVSNIINTAIPLKPPPTSSNSNVSKSASASLGSKEPALTSVVNETKENKRKPFQSTSSLSTKNPALNCVEGKENKKKAFPFLKKGTGLVKYKGLGKAQQAAHKMQPKTVIPRVSPRQLKFKRVTFEDKRSEMMSEPSILDVKIFESRKPNADVARDTKDSKNEDHGHKEDAEELAEFEILEQVAHNCSLDSDSSLINQLLTANPNVQTKPCESPIAEETIPKAASSPLPEPEIRLPVETQRPPFRRTVQSSSSSSSSSLEELLPSGDLPASALPSNRVDFDDEHRWKDDSVFDWSTNSSVTGDSISEDSSHKGIALAFDEMRAELLKVPETSPNINRLMLQERLKELEEEIAAFRKENLFLAKLKAQHQQMAKDLEKQKLQFKKTQEEQEKKLQDTLKEERKKLKKQQQLFEMHQKAKQQFPDKQEREEIAALKTEVHRLSEEVKKQRLHWTAECGRLRTHVASVECEKDRLKSQLEKVQQEKDKLANQIKNQSTAIKSSKDVPRPPTVRPPRVIASKKEPIRRNPQKKSIMKNNIKKNERKNEPPEKQAETDNKAIRPGSEVNKESNDMKSVHFFNEPSDTPPIITIDSSDATNDKKSKDIVEEIQHFDKVEKILSNGEREFVYSSGTRKVISSDASTVQIYFYNGDVMINLSDKTEIYHFAQSGTKQTSYADGTVLLEFADGQIEKLSKNGMKELTYLDGTVHITFPEGTQEIRSPDGTMLRIQENGDELVEFTNGEKELRTKDFKKREYLNGSSKTIYNDGRQETRYPDGRIRIKDKDGNIVLDTKYTMT